MPERWSEKAWVLDLRKRLTTLVALSAVVGSALVALAFVGVLGNQSGDGRRTKWDLQRSVG